MGDPLTGGPSTGVQPTGAQPTHLARSSIPVWLPDALIRRMGARASAKIFAIRHRCYCSRCDRASSSNSNCLAFPDVRQNCSVDLRGAIHWGAIQQSRSVPSSARGSVPVDRSAGTHYSNWCFRVSEFRERSQWTCHPAGWRLRPAADLAATGAPRLRCCLAPKRGADSAPRSELLKEQPDDRWPRSFRGSELQAVCRS
jgi:hypothetical protein